MIDLELYAHFSKFVYEVHKDDGICFVLRCDYDNFTKGLPIDDSEKGFEAFITSNGDLCFNIDDVSHFFDDFETFKKTFMEEYGL